MKKNKIDAADVTWAEPKFIKLVDITVPPGYKVIKKFDKHGFLKYFRIVSEKK